MKYLSIIDKHLRRETKQLFSSMSTTPRISKTTYLFTTEYSVPNDTINTNYTYFLPTGIGILISVLLFIFVLQSCKKSHSFTNKRALNQDKPSENAAGDESLNRPQNQNNSAYHRMSSISKSVHVYHHVDSEYNELDESLELVHDPILGNIQHLGFPLKSNESHNSITIRKDNLNDSNKSLNVLQKPEDTCLNKDDSDGYLQPVFVFKNTDETHSYIDIIE